MPAERDTPKPLADLDEPYDPDWWIKKKLREENLSVLPEALELRLQLDQALEAPPDLCLKFEEDHD